MPVIRSPDTIVLAASGAASAHTGDTNESTLATVVLPPLGANAQLKIVAFFSFSGTAGAKTLKAKYGSTAIATQTPGATVTSIKWDVDSANTNSVSANSTVLQSINNSGSWTYVLTTTSVDTSSPQTLTITATNANGADTTTLVWYKVILYPKA
jgi:hypothetical protein